MQLDQNTCLYLFSALLQADGAIISIVGIFVIFKIQSLQSQIETIKNYLLSTNHGTTAIEFESDSVTHDRILKQSGNPRYQKWENINKEIAKCKIKTIVPTILLVSGMVGAIIGMLYAKSLMIAQWLFIPTIVMAGYHILVYIFVGFKILQIINGGGEWEKFPELKSSLKSMKDSLLEKRSEMKQTLQFLRFWVKNTSQKN